MRSPVPLMAVVLLASAAAAPAVYAKPLAGPFVVNDGLTFYLVNPTGQAFDLTQGGIEQVRGVVVAK